MKAKKTGGAKATTGPKAKMMPPVGPGAQASRAAIPADRAVENKRRK